MALTRKFLQSMGLDADKIDEVIAAHTETVNALKDQIDQEKAKAAKAQEEAEKAKAVQKELDELRKKVEADAEERKGKDYDALKKEFDDYKAEQEKKAVRAEKEATYKELLKDAGIPERHWAKILKYSDVDGVELDEKGKITTAKELMKEIKAEWGDHIETTKTEGAQTQTPPGDGAKTAPTTKEEIMKIKDRNERQKAIAEHYDLFGH